MLWKILWNGKGKTHREAEVLNRRHVSQVSFEHNRYFYTLACFICCRRICSLVTQRKIKQYSRNQPACILCNCILNTTQGYFLTLCVLCMILCWMSGLCFIYHFVLWWRSNTGLPCMSALCLNMGYFAHWKDWLLMRRITLTSFLPAPIFSHLPFSILFP